MRRVMLGVVGVSVATVLLAGVQIELRGLRSTDTAREAEVTKLRTLVASYDAEATLRAKEKLSAHDATLLTLDEQLRTLRGKLDWLIAQFEERTRLTAKQATEAIGSTRALSKTVESAQRLVDERTRQANDVADRLEARIAEQGTRLDRFCEDMRRNSARMTHDMLMPTVQLSGEDTVGSGTIIGSVPTKDSQGYDTYVLTANHVVRNILSDNPALTSKGIAVVVYGAQGRSELRCDVILRHPKHDLALLKLRSRDKVGQAASLVDPQRADSVELWTPVFAVGCPLGNDPIPTGGFVSSLDNLVRDTKYWMINAPTYYGNSGGGIFDADTRELVAVFSKIYTHGNTRPVVVPHMGLAVPMIHVYPWLEQEGYGFLVPNHKVTEAISGGSAAPAK